MYKQKKKKKKKKKKRKLDLNIDQLFEIIKTDHSESQEDYQNSRKVGRNQLTSENTQLILSQR